MIESLNQISRKIFKHTSHKDAQKCSGKKNFRNEKDSITIQKWEQTIIIARIHVYDQEIKKKKLEKEPAL